MGADRQSLVGPGTFDRPIDHLMNATIDGFERFLGKLEILLAYIGANTGADNETVIF